MRRANGLALSIFLPTRGPRFMPAFLRALRTGLPPNSAARPMLLIGDMAAFVRGRPTGRLGPMAPMAYT